MCYQFDEIYVIQLSAELNSRLIVRIVEQNELLYVLPFNIPDQKPLPIGILKDYAPIFLGNSTEDHLFMSKFIATNYPVINVLLWNKLQRRHGKGAKGKLFILCNN